MNLAFNYPLIYWNTANLIVDSGGEDGSTNYGRVAKAINKYQSTGVKISSIDINKSSFFFSPDRENNQILYGLFALSGINDEIAIEIINNRPYNSFNDFLNKVKINRPGILSLIKAGAFDEFDSRINIMKEYLLSICGGKEKLTMQNFQALIKAKILPPELNFQTRLFNFRKSLMKSFREGDYYSLIDEHYCSFYSEYFDTSKIFTNCGHAVVSKKDLDKQYNKLIEPAKVYIKEHEEELLEKLNRELLKEQWSKYAKGSLSTWEMDSLGTYLNSHELSEINKNAYNIFSFSNLIPEEVDYYFKRNGNNIPIYKTHRICGTVIAKDDLHSLVTILTPQNEVVDVKFTKDYYAKYKKVISEINPDGTKKTVEKGWFDKGTLIIVNGIKRDGMFWGKKYKKDNSHILYKILKVNKDGTIIMTNSRYGEDDV